jgi:hypothetical protein
MTSTPAQARDLLDAIQRNVCDLADVAQSLVGRAELAEARVAELEAELAAIRAPIAPPTTGHRAESLAERKAAIRRLGAAGDYNGALAYFGAGVQTIHATPGCEREGLVYASMPRILDLVAETAEFRARAMGVSDAD